MSLSNEEKILEINTHIEYLKSVINNVLDQKNSPLSSNDSDMPPNDDYLIIINEKNAQIKALQDQLALLK